MESENRQALLTLAQAHGYAVSAQQLARWHRAGLLPRPRQLAQGKARGTQTLYPAGTGKQLLRLCELHTNERRLSYLAWQLWWDSYPVDIDLIRSMLHATTLRLTEQVRSFIALQASEQQAGEEGQEDMLDRIERLAAARLDYKPLRRARKRTGKEHFPTFMRILIEIASGSFSGYTTDSGLYDERERMTELRIIAKGMGFEETFIRDDANIAHYMGKVIAPLLQQVSTWLSTFPWERALEQTTSFELLQARDQLRFFLTNIPRAWPMQREILRDYPTWSISLQETFQELGMDDIAILLIALIALRNR